MVSSERMTKRTAFSSVFCPHL